MSDIGWFKTWVVYNHTTRKILTMEKTYQSAREYLKSISRPGAYQVLQAVIVVGNNLV